MFPHMSAKVYRDPQLKGVRITEFNSHFIEHTLFVKQAYYLSLVRFNLKKLQPIQQTKN